MRHSDYHTALPHPQESRDANVLLAPVLIAASRDFALHGFPSAWPEEIPLLNV